MAFTEDQLKAINTTERSVLVSAAAGSGKTAVLIERMIRIICEGMAGVDEMLVVTFTKAAAAEMKHRLAGALRARIAEHPEEAKHLKKQLSVLYRSYISTIDSFALRVIREFFHYIDIEPDFTMADEVRSELMRREAAAELFEDAFENDSLIEGGSFRAFLRLYSDERSDDAFIEGLLKSYSGLRSMPDYFEWAYDRAGLLKTGPGDFDGSLLQKVIAGDARDVFAGVCEAFRRLRDLFDGAGLSDMYDKKLGNQEAVCFDIYNRLQEGEFGQQLIDEICGIPTATVRASKDEKESYESIKDEAGAIRKAFKKSIDNWKSEYLAVSGGRDGNPPSAELRFEEMNATYEYTVYYLRMLEEFERRYDEKKRAARVMDFADAEHNAVRILKNKEAADVLRKRFKYIFVDEYQDTNNIQEYLISQIACPDNVFRVGDVKQSIYRFRQAEPEIFENLYRRISDGSEGSSTVIDLSRNFRTGSRIIDYINKVFGSIMEGYDERAMLYAGVECDPEYDFIPEVHVLFEEDSAGGGEQAGAAHEADDDEYDTDDEDDEIEELTKEEAEAEYIAGLAESIIGKEFFDTKTRTVRRAEARDIVILLRAVKRRGEIISRALRARSLEPHVEETEDYFDTVEIGVALSLLICIDNMKRDVPLISVLHSEIFGFDPRQMAEIRTAFTEYLRSNDPAAAAARPPYYKAFAWYAQDGPDAGLKNKAAAAYGRLLEWRRLSRVMPLGDFVWKVLTDSGYYRMAGAMSEGARRQANLRALADKASAFSRDNIASLSSFISFAEMLKSRGTNNGQAAMAGSDDDIIRIMTIHKSKGLEFPFVIVGGLGHKFREDSSSRTFSFDSSLGVGLPYVDPGRKYWRSTMMQRAVSSKSRRDGYKEEIRLLYVAMTRARNGLYMVGTAKSEEDLSKYETRPRCFISAMKNVLRTAYNSYHASPLERTGSGDADPSRRAAFSVPDGPLTAEEQRLYDELDRRFSYRYPYEDLLTAKAKYSVSEIRRSESDPEAVRRRAPDHPAGAEKKKKVSAADIGTAYHRIMEFLDFSKVMNEAGEIDEDYAKERADYLHNQHAIEDDVYDCLDMARITEFFESDIGRRVVSAARRGVLKREKPFTLRTVRDGRQMLVQGVIDCCFEEDGEMVLIDYKTSWIRPGRPHEEEISRIKDEYKVQMQLYSEAIRKGTGMDVKEAYLYLFAAGEAVRADI